MEALRFIANPSFIGLFVLTVVAFDKKLNLHLLDYFEEIQRITLSELPVYSVGVYITVKYILNCFSYWIEINTD